MTTTAGARRILLVSQFFAPEAAAPAARFHDFGRRWVHAGRDLTVITGMPNFPSGVVAEPYRGRTFLREERDGITVLRSWLLASPRMTVGHKGAGYASFAATATAHVAWASLLRTVRPDVVIATLPPPTVGVPALVAAGLHRVPLVVDVRDLWPEAVVASGKVRNPAVRAAVTGLATALYRTAKAVVAVSRGKAERLAELGVAAHKLAVIPNGTDLELARTPRPVDDLWAAWGVERDAWKVIYAGIHNPPQGLDVLIDAAANVRERRPDVWQRARFVLVGSGSAKAALVARAHGLGLDRVVFAPEQPREVIPSLLAGADVSVVPLKRRKDTHTVPSKIFESLGSGRPLVASLDGEAAEIARESGGAIVTPPEDGGALAQALTTLYDDRARAAAMGAAGRAFVATDFNRDHLAQRFLDVLDAVVTGRAVPAP